MNGSEPSHPFVAVSGKKQIDVAICLGKINTD